MASSLPSSLPLLLTLLPLLSPAISTTFTITNNCDYTVWPGILSGAGAPPVSTTGFSLSGGQSHTLTMSPSWSGRLWGRTLCSGDPSTAKFSCATGDCGSGDLSCSGGGAAPPATLAEFTLSGSGDLDFFDVSLVDGYNLPIVIVPQGGGAAAGKCTATGCAVDINGLCPPELCVEDEGKSVVACRSGCGAFGKAEFCCSGEYGNPNTCKPSSYSELFKKACPRAYSYAYDDASSTFTCATGTDYEITFCPAAANSQKAGEKIPTVAKVPLINDTMKFMGVVDTSNAVRTKTWSTIFVSVIVFWLTHLHHLFF